MNPSELNGLDQGFISDVTFIQKSERIKWFTFELQSSPSMTRNCCGAVYDLNSILRNTLEGS